MSEKAHVKRAKALRISAWVLLAISVPTLIWCAVQHFTAEPFIPEEPVPPNAIIGYADTTTYIYTVSKLPTYLFWGALLLFAVGIGVLLTPKIKKWKGKTHDR